MKQLSKYVFVFLISMPVLSFAEVASVPVIHNKTVGKWKNVYRGNTDLKGIYVQQFPDNIHSSSDYEGKHPAMVIYVFKSMKAHQIEYGPNGQVKNDFWWEVNEGDKLLAKLKQY